jgi:hypothetical protein
LPQPNGDETDEEMEQRYKEENAQWQKDAAEAQEDS